MSLGHSGDNIRHFNLLIIVALIQRLSKLLLDVFVWFY